jgi:hypothetical protein
MKRIVFLLGLWLVSTPWLSAQVEVSLVMDQEQYLPHEPLLIGVRITNLSGQTLELGQDDDWLSFAVETWTGKPVPQVGDVPVRFPFTLESSKVGTRTVDIAPYFRMDMPGGYRVTAIVKLKQWNQRLTSLAKELEITKGTKIWEQVFGVPTADENAKTPPEVRKFSLFQSSYTKHNRLYVRLTDGQEKQVYRVFPIAPMVSFGQPEAQLDRNCYLHVLCQTGARSFTYCVIDPGGQLGRRYTYDYTNTRPVLRSNGEGSFRVMGGIRRVTLSDLPPPLAPKAPADLITTNAVPTKS